MKTRLLFLTAAFYLAPVSVLLAYHAELTMRLSNNNAFTLSLNGVQYDYENYYHITNLQPGVYNVMVHEYVVEMNRHRPKTRLVLRYSGSLHLEPGFRMNAVISNYNSLIIDNKVPISVTLPGPVKPRRPVHPGTNTPHYIGMEHSTFNHLLAVLTSTSFDNTRLSIARQAVAANSVNTQQVLAIMQTFSFESNRLSFAKYAYSFCVDKGNYFIVNKAFTFESSKTDLMRYIGLY
jgi:hypothetical protein